MEKKRKAINALSLATTRQQRAKMKMRHSHKHPESHEECEQLIWNSLSFALRPSPSLPAFKIIFKTYLFKHDSDQQQFFFCCTNRELSLFRSLFSSVQFKMVSVRSEKPTCAPSSLSESVPIVAFEMVPMFA